MRSLIDHSDEEYWGYLVGVVLSTAFAAAVFPLAYAANAALEATLGVRLCSAEELADCAKTVATVAAVTLEIPLLAVAAILYIQSRRGGKNQEKEGSAHARH